MEASSWPNWPGKLGSKAFRSDGLGRRVVVRRGSPTGTLTIATGSAATRGSTTGRGGRVSQACVFARGLPKPVKTSVGPTQNGP